MLTVRDVLTDLDVQLLAGEDGLDAPVRWVHISELTDPTPFLSGGELLLTTGMALDSAKAQRDYIDRLADHGLAGLGYGTGLRAPEGAQGGGRRRARRAASRCSRCRTTRRSSRSPSAPSRAWSTSSTRCCAGRSPRRSGCRASSSASAGSTAIVAAIAALVGGPALVFDGRGELEAMHAFRRALEPEAVAAIGEELRDRARRGEARGFVPAHADLSTRALALPVGSPDAPDGVPARRPG